MNIWIRGHVLDIFCILCYNDRYDTCVRAPAFAFFHRERGVIMGHDTDSVQIKGGFCIYPNLEELIKNDPLRRAAYTELIRRIEGHQVRGKRVFKSVTADGPFIEVLVHGGHMNVVYAVRLADDLTEIVNEVLGSYTKWLAK